MANTIPLACLLVTILGVVIAGIAPSNRADWLLESVPTLIALPLTIYGARRFRFSDRAYLQATLLVLLHTVGSHYTYSGVPIGHWFQQAFGWSRNDYDRFVHFAFGGLILRPILELGFRRGHGVGWFGVLYFNVAAVAGWSMLYEVVEWLVASTVDPAAGTAYLGTQGDAWDAQKDMALATCGAVIAAVVERRTVATRRHSVRPSGDRPLG